MSANFSSGVDLLTNDAAPVASGGYPLMVGAWVRALTIGTARRFWSLNNPADAVNYFLLGMASGSSVWNLTAGDSTTSTTVGSTTVVVGRWYFLLGRFLAANQRALDTIDALGNVVANQSTVARTPVGLSRMALGCRSGSTNSAFYDGLVAELWYGTVPAILSANAALDPSLLRKLAYGGPFSVPSIGASVIEYRSLRKHPTLGGRRDVVTRGIANPTWINSGGVTVGVHPPLPA